MKRRPAPVVQAPERLRRFVPLEWDVPPMQDNRTGWQAQNWDRVGPFYAWRDARRIWSADHGDALGDFVRRFLYERDVLGDFVRRFLYERDVLGALVDTRRQVSVTS